MRIQDTLDVCACHGLAGTWKAIATGIFASKAINPAGADGLIHGNWHLLVAQLITPALVWGYAFTVTFVLARVVDAVLHFTANTEEQERGLDVYHYGEKLAEQLTAAGSVATGSGGL